MNGLFKKNKNQTAKLFLVLMLTFSMVTGSAFASSNPSNMVQGNATDGETAFSEGQLIISVEAPKGYSIQSTDSAIGNQMSVLEAAGLNVVDSLLDSSTQVDGRMTTQSVDETLKAELKAKGLSVRYIEPNYTMYAFAMNPSQEWHYNMIKAPQAWTVTNGSSNVKIAVLDTGIDNNHQNLQNFVDMSLAKSFVGGTTMDVQKHGTQFAGTIASYGDVSGVMQNTSLVPVKVLGDDGSGSTYGIQQGILYASSIKADVINMSLGGGGYSQGMDEACQTATNAGVVVIAAAGNSGTSTISYPAAYSSVIAVGAVDQNKRRASFSQYGTGLSVMAPGTDIYSTVPNNLYDAYSGTSMATPHVVGVSGLIRSVNKGLTAVLVRSILTSTAVNAGTANEYGFGIVDAYAAVKAAGGQIVDPPTEYATKTSVTTNKEIYKRGDSITTTVKVLDQDGSPVANANVAITITRPNGTTFTTNKVTNASGIATNVTASSTSTALGTFTIKAETTLEGYTSSAASKTIQFTRYGY